MKSKLINVGASAISLFAIVATAAAEVPAKAKYSRKGADSYAAARSYFDWNGFYVGGNFGSSWGKSATDATFSNPTTGASYQASDSFKVDGWIGGAQAGYNVQFGEIVVGIEGDYQRSGQQGTTNLSCPSSSTSPATACNFMTASGGSQYPINVVYNQKIDWLSTARLRAGVALPVAFGPPVLAYVTGGAAIGHVSTDGTMSTYYNTGGSFNNLISSNFAASAIKGGWTVGAGAEARLIGNWTAKVEYLYVNLGTTTATASIADICNGSSGGGCNPPTPNPRQVDFSSRVTDHILRLGLNLKFDGLPLPRF